MLNQFEMLLYKLFIAEFDQITVNYNATETDFWKLFEHQD